MGQYLTNYFLEILKMEDHEAVASISGPFEMEVDFDSQLFTVQGGANVQGRLIESEEENSPHNESLSGL